METDPSLIYGTAGPPYNPDCHFQSPESRPEGGTLLNTANNKSGWKLAAVYLLATPIARQPSHTASYLSTDIRDPSLSTAVLVTEGTGPSLRLPPA